MTVRGILPILPLALDRLMRLGSSHPIQNRPGLAVPGITLVCRCTPRPGSRPRPRPGRWTGQQSESLMTVAQPAEDETPAEIDIVEEWGEQSFPASDPPQNW
jgi:hypothetical protein